MMRDVTTCPGCDESIASQSDIDFIEIDTADEGLLSFSTTKKMYVVACGHCEVILGGGVGALG